MYRQFHINNTVEAAYCIQFGPDQSDHITKMEIIGYYYSVFFANGMVEM
jgi:hypothetical protein